MLVRDRVHRLFGVLAMVLQLALPGTLAYADAMLQRASTDVASVHIEDHSRPSCHVVHGADCALCQALSHLSAPRGTPVRIPAARLIGAAGAGADGGIAPNAIWGGPPPSRGPPG